MTIQTRKTKINTTKVTPLIGKDGRMTEYQVEGSNDGTYHVYIPSTPLTGKYHGQVYYEYRTTCHCKNDPYTFPACKGNSNGTACYHVLAAIKDRAARKNKTLSLPQDGEQWSAQKLLYLGGQLIKITNQNGNSKWGVVR